MPNEHLNEKEMTEHLKIVDKRLFMMINELRASPKSWIPALQEHLGCFDNKGDKNVF